MYPEMMVIPMREELVRAGIKETRTAEDVDAALAQARHNAGGGELHLRLRRRQDATRRAPGAGQLGQPARAQDHGLCGSGPEATERARSYFEGKPPTSPAVAILRDGKLVYLMQRYVIEQATAQQIAGELVRAFDEFCAKTTA